MVTLGHHLRADDDVGFARLYALDDLPHLDQRGHEVGGQQRHARGRKALRGLLGNTLHTRSAGDERARLAALGALFRDRQREAAVVAIEPLAIAMLDQPCGALRAIDAVTAGATER